MIYQVVNTYQSYDDSCDVSSQVYISIFPKFSKTLIVLCGTEIRINIFENSIHHYFARIEWKHDFMNFVKYIFVNTYHIFKQETQFTIAHLVRLVKQYYFKTLSPLESNPHNDTRSNEVILRDAYYQFSMTI